MKRQILSIFAIAMLAAGFVACEKEEAKPENGGQTPVNPLPNPADTTGTDTTVAPTAHYALVLNEGGYQQNNASISRIDLTTGAIDNNWFAAANGRGLGDQAQDMVAYGSKVYVTVTESNTLEVINPRTGTSNSISMGTRQPRSIAADGGYLYITCYSPACVVRVDTLSLAIDATCMLGQYKPEGIAIAQGKAFVAGAYNDAYEFDENVYVIDLASFATATPLHVASNHNQVARLNDNKIIVSWGNGTASSPNGSALIDATTLTVTPYNKGLSRMAVYNGEAYCYSADYDASYNIIVTWHKALADGTTAAFPFTPAVEDAYGIDIDPTTGNVYICAWDYYSAGTVYAYSPTGSKLLEVEAANGPSKILFF